MKTIEILTANGGIVITPKEGQIAKQVQTENGILITFEDQPKKKTFYQYVKEYIDSPFLFPRNYFLTGDAEFLKTNVNVMIWPYELKMGLLKFIADELNENDGVKNCFLMLRENKLLTDKWSVSFTADVLFTEQAAEKACKIIPIEFMEKINQ